MISPVSSTNTKLSTKTKSSRLSMTANLGVDNRALPSALAPILDGPYDVQYSEISGNTGVKRLVDTKKSADAKKSSSVSYFHQSSLTLSF